MKQLETLIYVAAMAMLSGLLWTEGRRFTELSAQEPLSPKAAYALLSNPQVKVQLVDLRPYDDEHYLDGHIPGAIPLPDCDLEKAPQKAQGRAYAYVNTIIITGSGDAAAFESCRRNFGQARLLQGGMAAWSDARLPDEPGDYTPPKSSAGGGCL